MHGKRAADLLEVLNDAKFLPAYNEPALRTIAAEIKELLEALLEAASVGGAALKKDLSAASGLIVFHRAIERNKRGALAYLYERLRRIVNYRWEAGASAATHLDGLLSAHEDTFLNEYGKILGRYFDEVELDLTADRAPPQDLYVEVRVIRDCGSVMTDNGSVALKQGTAHFLKRSDVEHLIRQGALEHIIM